MPSTVSRSTQVPRPIARPRVLIVEGRDAERFFHAMLVQMGLRDDFDILDWRSVGDWRHYAATLRRTPGFRDVTALGFVRDAEASAESAFQSVCGLVRDVALSVPPAPMAVADGNPRVSVYILPDCREPGMLETLCLRSLGDDPVLRCVDEYLACVVNAGAHPPRHPAKARLHAFLASREKPDLLLGEAAQAGYFPWHSPAFDPLKRFLLALAGRGG